MDVRATPPPKSYVTFTSPSTKSSLKSSSSCVYCSRSPSVTAGRVVVNGFARMLNASVRFQPSVPTRW
jgi:hypothetical protein